MGGAGHSQVGGDQKITKWELGQCPDTKHPGWEGPASYQRRRSAGPSPATGSGSGWLVASEGVADGQAIAGDVRGAEVQVVVDEVEFRLGTDEEAALGIELDADAEVSHEVFVARVIGVVAIAAALTVDTGVDCAEAADQYKIGVARQFGRVDGVDIQKDRAKRKRGVAAVIALGCLPVDFSPDT